MGIKSRIAAAIAGAGLLGIFAAPEAKADFAYAYAQQTLTNITLTGQNLGNFDFLGSFSTSSSVLTGTGISNNDAVDAPLSYLGAPPPSPQNGFLKYSVTGGGPQAGNFTRGDSAITSAALLNGAGASASLVAESFISSAAGQKNILTGNGTFQIAATFTSATTANITVGYNWANDIMDLVSGTIDNPAISNFVVNFTVSDQHGHQVKSSPSELQSNLAAPPNGPEIITSGSGSSVISLGGLTAGDTFRLVIAGEANSGVGNTNVGTDLPEPASLGMIGLAGLGLMRRRRRD